MHKTKGQKAEDAERRRKGHKRKTKKGRKIGRNKVKCAIYRMRVGKPRGPGQTGNKSGKNKTRR